MNKKELLKLIYINIIIYLFIYLPPIFSLSILNILFLISVIHLGIQYKSVLLCLKKILNIKNLFLLFFIFLYVIALFIFKNHSFSFIYSNIVLIVESIVIAIYIAYFFFKNKYDNNKLLLSIVSIGLIQALFAILMFCVRDLQELFIKLCIYRGFDPVPFEQFKNYRFFGFSSELTFTMPIVQILITYIALIKVKFNIKNQLVLKIIISLLLLFSAIINARISIVILLICFFLYYIFTIFDKKTSLKKKKIVNLIVLSCILGIIILFLINSIFNIEQLDWILTSIKEILMIFGIKIGSVDEINTFSLLFNSIKFPNIKDIWFGLGINIFNTEFYRSDIGYLNNIWYGGIVYCIAIYTCFLKFIFSKKKIMKNDLLFKLILIFVFFISNIKGNVFGVNSLFNFTLLYIFNDRRLYIKQGVNDED